MSFSRDTKNELSRVMPEKECCRLAEIAGFIRVSGAMVLLGEGRFRIRLTTENLGIARKMNRLIKTHFQVATAVEVAQGQTLKKGRHYTIAIGPDEKSEEILRTTGMLLEKEGLNVLGDGIMEQIIATKCCKKSYLRGLFCGSGTMSNPEKGYQYEIKCATKKLATQVRKLINSFSGLHAKETLRKKEHIVYVRESRQILDLLAIMGAHSQYFVFEDIRIKKELRNEANRLSNCDQANIDKTIAAASKQIQWIEKVGKENLPEELKPVAQLRLDNPHVSLSELGAMMDPPLKKGSINGRLKKIERLAMNTKNN